MLGHCWQTFDASVDALGYFGGLVVVIKGKDGRYNFFAARVSLRDEGVPSPTHSQGDTMCCVNVSGLLMFGRFVDCISAKKPKVRAGKSEFRIRCVWF